MAPAADPPANSAGPSGFPDQQDLPVLEWEVEAWRFRIPSDLQARIQAPTPVVRVPVEIHAKIARDAFVAPFYGQLTQTMERWQYISEQVATAKWRIILRISDERIGKQWPLLVVIGRDVNGSYNLVSMHRREESFVRRLQREGLLEHRAEER